MMHSNTRPYPAGTLTDDETELLSHIIGLNVDMVSPISSSGSGVSSLSAGIEEEELGLEESAAVMDSEGLDMTLSMEEGGDEWMGDGVGEKDEMESMDVGGEVQADDADPMGYEGFDKPRPTPGAGGGWMGNEMGIKDDMETAGVGGEMEVEHQVRREDDVGMDWICEARGGPATISPSMFMPSDPEDGDESDKGAGTSTGMGAGEPSDGPRGSIGNRDGGGSGVYQNLPPQPSSLQFDASQGMAREVIMGEGSGVYENTPPQPSDLLFHASHGVVPVARTGSMFTAAALPAETGSGVGEEEVLETSSSGANTARNLRGAPAPSVQDWRQFPLDMPNYSPIRHRTAGTGSGNSAVPRPSLLSNTSTGTIFTPRYVLSSTPSAGSTSTSVDASPLECKAQIAPAESTPSSEESDSPSVSAVTERRILGARKFTKNVPAMPEDSLGIVETGQDLGARVVHTDGIGSGWCSGVLSHGVRSTDGVQAVPPGPSDGDVVTLSPTGQAEGVEQRVPTIEKEALGAGGPWASQHEFVLGRVRSVPPATVPGGGSFQRLVGIRGPTTIFHGDEEEERMEGVASTTSRDTREYVRGVSNPADASSDNSTHETDFVEAPDPGSPISPSSPEHSDSYSRQRGLALHRALTPFNGMSIGDDGLSRELNRSPSDISPARAGTLPGVNPSVHQASTEGQAVLAHNLTTAPVEYQQPPQRQIGALNALSTNYGRGSSTRQFGRGQDIIPLPVENVMAQIGLTPGIQAGSRSNIEFCERGFPPPLTTSLAGGRMHSEGGIPSQELTSGDKPFMGQVRGLPESATVSTQSVVAQRGVVVDQMNASRNGRSMVQYPALPLTRLTSQGGILPAPDNPIGDGQLLGHLGVRPNPPISQAGETVAPVGLVPTRDFTAMQRPFVGHAGNVSDAATAPPGNLMGLELIAPVPRRAFGKVSFISTGEGVMEEEYDDAAPGPSPRGGPFLRQTDQMTTPGAGLSMIGSTPAIHYDHSPNALMAPLSGHSGGSMGRPGVVPSITPVSNSGASMGSVGLARSTDGPQYEDNEIYTLISTRDGNMCWACERLSGLELMSLLSVEDIQRFGYYRSLNLLPFPTPHHADNLILLCPSCRAHICCSPAGLIILPSDLNFLVLFEEADFLRRARTGEPRSVPTANEYAPRGYTVYRAHHGAASLQRRFVENKAWGGMPTALVMKGIESIGLASTEVPEGDLVALEMLMGLYSRSEKPSIVDVKREMAIAMEMLRVRSIIGFAPVGPPVGTRQAVADTVLSGGDENLNIIVNSPSPTQSHIDEGLSHPEDEAIPAQYPTSLTDGPFPDTTPAAPMSPATANLLDRYKRVTQHLAAREMAFGPDEPGCATRITPNSADTPPVPTGISSFASFLGASLVAEAVAQHGLEGSQAVGESARWALAARGGIPAMEDAGGDGCSTVEEPAGGTGYSTEEEPAGMAKCIPKEEQAGNRVARPPGGLYFEDPEAGTGEGKKTIFGMNWWEGIEADVEAKRRGEFETENRGDAGNTGKSTPGTTKAETRRLEMDRRVGRVYNLLLPHGEGQTEPVLGASNGHGEGSGMKTPPELIRLMTDGGGRGGLAPGGVPGNAGPARVVWPTQPGSFGGEIAGNGSGGGYWGHVENPGKRGPRGKRGRGRGKGKERA